MADARRILGTEGEDAAARFLEGKGLRVLGRQVKTRFGEIDLVCQEGREIVFVEVKARRTGTYGYPEESVTRIKAARMARCGEAYMMQKESEGPWRMDVVAVEWRENAEPVITHFPGIDTSGASW